MSYEGKNAAAGDEEIPNFSGYWEMIDYDGLGELAVRFALQSL